jgi:uncharacterized protein YoxC
VEAFGYFIALAFAVLSVFLIWQVLGITIRIAKLIENINSVAKVFEVTQDVYERQVGCNDTLLEALRQLREELHDTRKYVIKEVLRRKLEGDRA